MSDPFYSEEMEDIANKVKVSLRCLHAPVNSFPLSSLLE